MQKKGNVSFLCKIFICWLRQRLTRMHVGKRGYEPVVSTSIAKGMAKLGRRACTRASLASNASLSAVSTNKIVCWSRKLEIICYQRNHRGGRSRAKMTFTCALTVQAATHSVVIKSNTTYRTLFYFPCIARPLHQGQEAHKQLPGSTCKLDNLNFPEGGTTVKHFMI